MRQPLKHHSVVPVQPRNPAFTYCAVCHGLLFRDEQGHWVHSQNQAVTVQVMPG
jgi:hypothetical protein